VKKAWSVKAMRSVRERRGDLVEHGAIVVMGTDYAYKSR
jgi:hypothetical protein